MTRFDPPHSSQPWERNVVYKTKYYREHYWFSKVNGLMYLSIKSAWYTVEVEEEDEDGYPCTMIGLTSLLVKVCL
jgi:hypothetical protein